MAFWPNELPDHVLFNEAAAEAWWWDKTHNHLVTDIIDGNFGVNVEEARELVALINLWLAEVEAK